jgi:DNA-binding NtrC family response regulator
MNGKISNAARILIVDDEPTIRELIAEFLRGNRFAVVEATDGFAALRHLDHSHEEFSLVISDLQMPGLNGLDLLARIRKSVPRLPALLISGYFDDTAALEAILDDRTRFLAKPFDFSALERQVQGLLTGGNTIGSRRRSFMAPPGMKQPRAQRETRVPAPE